MTQPLIAVIMGSKSDWETMEHATKILDQLNIPYEVKIVSAHRTPDLLFQFAESAHERGIEVIIAGAGGAICGMTAAKHTRARCSDPIEGTQRHGSAFVHRKCPPASLLARLPSGAAVNAALLAPIVANKHEEYCEHCWHTVLHKHKMFGSPDPRDQCMKTIGILERDNWDECLR
jgi:5-(carboxyamino)imidazole ribonucleotide mutase